MQQGFFDLGTAPKTEPLKPKGLSVGGCDACGRGCRPLKVFGKGKKRILIVTEFPSKIESQSGEYHAGDTGDYLQKVLKARGISLFQDCWTTSAVLCAGPEATTAHAQFCSPKLEKTIEELNPDIIIGMGYLAVAGIVGNRLIGRIKKVKYQDFYGECIPDQESLKWLCFTSSPAECLGKYNDANRTVFGLELDAAISKVGTKVPKYKPVPEITTNVEKAISWLYEARMNADEIAFDYETSGIKPHREGHFIATASLAYRLDGKLICQSFPFFEDETFVKAWKQLMLSNKVKKIAHKADFEMSWTFNRGGGVWPRNWSWDTCLAAHCLSNKKSTSLKFQTFAKVGVVGFDSKVDRYLETLRPGEDHGDTNALNIIYQAPQKDLLEYNALDSAYTLILKEAQEAEFKTKPHLLEGLDILLRGSIELVIAHQNGLLYDESQMTATLKEISTKANEALTTIRNSDEYKIWWNKRGKVLNPGSSQQLKELFKLMGIESSTGQMNEEALVEIGTPFALEILRYRKLEKIAGFIKGYTREAVEGIIHPFYNLHIAKTFRSSSDSPNFQNIPKRDKEAKNLIRGLFKARPGCRIIEYDYKAVEVAGSACYHKDPTMIDYIHDPATDMHRDSAMDMFLRGPNDWLKEERQSAKNGYVFPAFYGSTAVPNKRKGEKVGAITKGIWNQIPKETIEHLYSKGIKSIEDFQSHIEVFEKNFWSKRFPVYYQWRESMYQQAVKDGYYDTLTGFRIHMPAAWTEMTNAPIQGTAFHFLLYTLTTSGPEVRKTLSDKTFFIGQIHDAIIANVAEEDEEEMDKLIKEIGTQRIRARFPSIIVPLTIEKERSPVGGSWRDMEGCGNL